MLIGAPSEIPHSAARSEPAASITARTSSIRCSSVGASATGSDSPDPRRSNVDHPRERGERLEEARRRLVLPDQLDVGDEAGDDDEVELALAEDLVGDVDVAAAGV